MQTIVIEVVSDDELTVTVLRFRGSEDCIEAKADLLVNPLEEIFLGWFGNKTEDVSK